MCVCVTFRIADKIVKSPHLKEKKCLLGQCLRREVVGVGRVALQEINASPHCIVIYNSELY